MSMKKILIVGAGGREAIFAVKLMEDSRVYALMPHKNPTIIDCVERSNGQYHIGDSGDPNTVLTFAIEAQVDYVFVSADGPLANGVVDVLLNHGIKAIGGTKEATRIEWDKIYAIDMVHQLCPEYTPHYQSVSSQEKLTEAMQAFRERGLEVVVKPQGLTGGKGVKVMPEHLPTYRDAMAYAAKILETNDHVLLMEKVNGLEFTIMGITDGEKIVLAPATYDYPFREEGDKGAGTGGMGCFTGKNKALPFLTKQDTAECEHIMKKVLKQIKEDGLLFNGVLNGGFFKTEQGIKFMEFNGRLGDPEGLNVLSILKSSFSELLVHLWHKTLSEDAVLFVKKASVVKYLVAKEYPLESAKSSIFSVNTEAIASKGVSIFFASAEKRTDGNYQTLKKSRVVALVALDDEIATASDRVNEVIEKYITGDLEYRSDIGATENLKTLKR